MKTFHATFDKSYGWGTWDEVECIIIANIESEALGMALTKYSDTVADGWTFEEIDTTTPAVHTISKRSN